MRSIFAEDSINPYGEAEMPSRTPIKRPSRFFQGKKKDHLGGLELFSRGILTLRELERLAGSR